MVVSKSRGGMTDQPSPSKRLKGGSLAGVAATLQKLD
jgi:hypothetical protein